MDIAEILGWIAFYVTIVLGAGLVLIAVLVLVDTYKRWRNPLPGNYTVKDVGSASTPWVLEKEEEITLKPTGVVDLTNLNETIEFLQANERAVWIYHRKSGKGLHDEENKND